MPPLDLSNLESGMDSRKHYSHCLSGSEKRIFFFSWSKIWRVLFLALSLSLGSGGGGLKNGHTLDSGIYLRKIITDVHIDLPIRMFVTVF